MQKLAEFWNVQASVLKQAFEGAVIAQKNNILERLTAYTNILLLEAKIKLDETKFDGGQTGIDLFGSI